MHQFHSVSFKTFVHCTKTHKEKQPSLTVLLLRCVCFNELQPSCHYTKIHVTSALQGAAA